MKQFYLSRFKGKAIILTGATRGIGETTAARAAKEGAKLVLASWLGEEGERVLNAARAEGNTAIFLNLDLSAEEYAEQVVGATVKTYGHLDTAINNAGVMGDPSPSHELEQEQMDYTMANNFYSVFFYCKHEIREFTKEGNGGVIVNNTPIVGFTSLPGDPAYVASRYAVNGLTKNLAFDHVRCGIHINSVNPVDTTMPMVAEAYEYMKNHREAAIKASMDPTKARSMVGQKLASMLEREVTTKEQAAPILFLISDDTTRMTGTTAQTDGGWAFS